MRRFVPWLALPLLAVILYARPLFLGETFIQRDHLQFTLSARQHLADELRAGRLPEWWAENGLGVPFAANPNHGVTYPPAWLVAVLPSPFAADALQILHALLGAVGLAFLARRLGAPLPAALFGGAAFLASGYVTSMNVNGIPLLTLAWTPWVAWAACGVASAARGERARAMLRLGALLAAQVLSGDPAGVVTSVLLAAMLGASRASRPLAAFGRLGAAALGSVALAALAVAPSLALLGESSRAGGVTTAEASVWSLHPWRLLELIWPGVVGDAADERLHLARLVADTGARGGIGPSWSLGAHLGLPVLFMAVLGGAGIAERRARVVTAVGALLFLLLALGDATPLYAAYRYLFLPERFLRYPEKHLAGALVLGSALAALGFARLFLEAPRKRDLILAAAAVALFGVLVTLAWLARAPLESWLAERRPARPPDVDVPGALRHALTGGLSMAITGLVFLVALGLRGRAARAAGGLAALAVVAHLVSRAWPLLPTLPRDALLTPPSWWASDLTADAPPQRIFRTLGGFLPRSAGPKEVALLYHESLGDRSAMRLGLAQVPGYDPAAAIAHKSLWRAADGPALGRFLDLYDVRWAVLLAGDPRGQGLEPGPPIRGGHQLFHNAVRRPRAFATSRWSWVSGANAQAALFDRALDLHGVRLEGDGRPGSDSGPLRPCRVDSHRPEEVRVSCPEGPAGFAVLLDAWSSGWTATVDGIPAPVLRAEALARAVPVGPGAHQILWRYRTPRLRAGALVSALAWAIWLAVLWRVRAPPAPSDRP